MSCIHCHLQEGVILATTVSGLAPHPSRVAPRLSTSAFCADCHDFNFAVVHPGGQISWTEEPMQSTFREWSLWSGAPSRSCQSCHMQDGGHRFPGAHDTEWLAESITVTLTRHHDRVRFIVETHDIGHAFPTGDLFRHLTVQIKTDEQPWLEVAWFGRRFVDDAASQTKRLVTDSRIFPGQPVWVDVPAAPLQWQLRYHYTQSEAPWVLLREGAVSFPD
ncbi:MAG: hypothetical protein AAFV53_07135 [Myxococcota bacterium]